MKKSLAITILILLFALVGGCVKQQQEGGLAVQIHDNGVQTQILVPDLDMQIASYVISGSGPAGKTFASTITNTSTFVKNKLAFGEWQITVYARNAAGVVIGQGTAVAIVHVGQTTPVQILVKPLEGTGTLDITVNWKPEDTENPAIVSELIPAVGTPLNLNYTLDSGTATYHNAALPAGYYSLAVQLKDSGILTMGAVEVVRIVKDRLTLGNFDFTRLNQPGGSISVGITPEMDDPFEVTLSGQQALLYPGRSMTVTASVPAEVGNVLYVWYINGLSVGTGSSYTVNAQETGVYRLDVTAFTVDGKRAGSTTHLFNVEDEPELEYWIKTYGGSGTERPGVVCSSGDGGLIIAGTNASYALTGISFSPTLFKLDGYGRVAWSKQYYAEVQGEFYAVCPSADGAFYAVGYHGNWGQHDALIVKFDTAGNTLWTRTLSYTGPNLYSSVAATPDGGCVVTGYGDTILNGVYNLLVAKYDALGNLEGHSTVYSMAHDLKSYCIKTTSDGGVVLVGDFNDTTATHALIVKLDASFGFQWSTILRRDPRPLTTFRSVEETSDGEFIAVGYITSGATFEEDDLLIVRFNNSGGILWRKLYGGYYNEMGYSIKAANNSNYIIAGQSSSFNPGEWYNFYLFEIDGAGTVQWEAAIGSSGEECCYDFVQDASGDIFAAGRTSSYGVSSYDFMVCKADPTAKVPGSPSTISFTQIDPREITTQESAFGGMTPTQLNLVSDIPVFIEDSIGMTIQDVTF